MQNDNYSLIFFTGIAKKYPIPASELLGILGSAMSHRTVRISNLVHNFPDTGVVGDKPTGNTSLKQEIF